ncbi:DUF5710 domain-containing protein [Brevundimonas nasdae]|uniref:DUF5710 domain-containing protein n=1 Tax=Brevundimonas nasdae TaxID=172043 RepID=UPI001F0A3559|nr:DUF5710 domain-containing protein [Brevundimonas nasdae]
MIEAGHSPADIAARFNIDEARVHRRLKLAKVSPKLIALYREGTIEFEQLAAFTLADDHAVQEAAYFDVPEGWARNAGHIRKRLTEGEVDASTDRLARFVGMDVYRAAGGAVRLDLFSLKGEGFIQDVALLQRLAAEKLSAEAAVLEGEGWKWVRVEPEINWQEMDAMGRIYEVDLPLSEEVTAQIEKLSEQYQALEAEGQGETVEGAAAIDAAVSQPVRETLKAYALTAAEVSAEIPAERTSMASDRAANVRGDTQQKDAPMRSEDAAPIIAPARVNLDVPFADKNEAKAAGAKWDKTEKTWFAPKGTDLAPLARWTGARAEEPELVPEVEFKEFLESHGYVFDKGELPIMDGEIHRQKVDGDKGSERSGAYVGYTDDHPAGFMERFGSKGYKLNWKSQQRTAGLSKEDRDRLAREGEAKQAERLAVRQAGYERAAAEVEKIVAACEPAPGTHRYLDAKNVLPSGVLMMTGIAAMPPGDPDPQQFGRPGNLLIPAHDIDGKVWTAQSISPGGMKSFPRGARLHGCHHLIGEASREGGDILVCEGWATGQTIHEATGKPVAVAFNANNLEAVAREYRDRFPDKAILILGDNDHRKEAEIDPATNLPKPNVGKEKAIAAARAVGGQAVLPPFRPTDQGSDWNDFATIHGEAATRRAIQEQLAIAMRRELTEEITASRDIDRDQPAQEREREREQGRAAMPDRDDDRPRRDLDPDRDRQREQDRDREPALTMGR